MANKPISQLDEITDPKGDDELLFLDSSNSNLKRVKFKDLGGNDNFDKHDYPFTILGRGTGTPSLVLDTGVISNGAFSNSGSVKAIHIGSKVTEVQANAFNATNGTQGLTFSEGLTGIGNNAFYNCGITGNVRFPDSLTSIGNNAFMFASMRGGDVKFGQNLTTLGSSAFLYCSFDTDTVLEFPDTFTTFGASAFGYSNLRAAKIGTGVTSINSIRNAFPANGGSLRTMEISSEHTGLASLSGAVYDKGLTSLEFVPGAFNAPLNLPSTCTGISSSAGFQSFISSLTMPEGLTSIGSFAFYYGNSFGGTSLVFPNSLTSLGDQAFVLNSMVSVTIPNGSIGANCFNQCGSMKTGTLGTGVTSVGAAAFNYCSALVELNCNIPLTSIGANAFISTSSSLVIHARASDSTWTAGNNQNIRGNSSVDVIKDL